MMLMITPDRRGEFAAQLDEMHKLRYRVFKNRLEWNVDTRDGKEADAFDAEDPVYLLLRGDEGSVEGCVRMLPCTGPTMLGEIFSVLLGDAQVPGEAHIWESSRFALDLAPRSRETRGGLTLATYKLFIGMVEFGVSRSLTKIVTVTDLRIERVLRRAGWPLQRIHHPKIIGSTTAIAGYLEISRGALNKLHQASGITGPVLWQPVVPPADPVFGTGGDRREPAEGEPGAPQASLPQLPDFN